MKVIAIIPARYASTRFPGKPLALLGGKPMIQRVYEKVAPLVDMAVVATDDAIFIPKNNINIFNILLYVTVS